MTETLVVWSPLVCPSCLAEGRIVRLVYVLSHDWHLCDRDHVLTGAQVSNVFDGTGELAA
jgi:hypothetical protein